MYRHTLFSKIYSIITVIVLIGLAIYIKPLGFKLLFILAAIIMARDVLRTFTAIYAVNEDGLFKKDIFAENKLVDWYLLEYLTITKRNRKWVALVSGENIVYIRNDIENREQMMKDIIKYAKKNKKLGVHDLINKKYNLALKLDDKGRIIKKSNCSPQGQRYTKSGY